MTLTVKDSAASANLGKPGTPSQDSENKANQSPRSNPVCLEAGITIRSLPAEAGNSIQPIREEGRTVIVFDNGAVLRSTSNLPPGLTVILSDSNGRDVVCRVVGGRNSPNVKGYVEVEFIEPVNDFWRIHQDSEPPSAPAPSALSAAPQQSRDGARAEVSEATTLERPATAPSGGGPTFEDIAGLVSMSPAVQTREKKIEPAKPFLEPAIKDDFTYTLAEPITPAISAVRDSSPATLRNPASAGDFLSKGMLASAPSDSSSSPLSGRMPVVLAGAALALGALSFGLYLMHGRKTVAPAAKVAVIDQAEPVAAVAPVPATITSSGDTEPPKVRRQEKNTSAGKPPDLSSSRRPVIPNLRINSPSAPNQTLASTNAGTVVPAEIAPPETTGEAPAAGFLSAVARTPNQPAPPPSAPGPAPVVKTIRDAKLISSTRPVYPAAAKASNIQGSVVISADIDANGNVVGAKAISGPVFLRQAASDAVKQWKYSPALVDGKPAPSQTTVSVDFRLN